MRVQASKDSAVSVAGIDGDLKFPLSWTSSPWGIGGYDYKKMSAYKQGVVGFLDRMKLTDIHILLNKETDSEDLELYLREYFRLSVLAFVSFNHF